MFHYFQWFSTIFNGFQPLAQRQRNGGDAAPPPLVVFTHCGPAMAALQTFVGFGSVCARFPLATWAEEGYSVLLPNYRGSTGYGRAFREANFRDWGGQDYNDVMTGFTYMSSTGRAALDRVAHVGWSYGGYMSARLMCDAPDAFVAAASVTGAGPWEGHGLLLRASSMRLNARRSRPP